MALADPLQLSPDTPTALTTNTIDFVTIKQFPDGKERLNQATDLSNPEKLLIRHTSSGTDKAGTLVDRHLISSSRVERDSDGNAHTCTVNVTLAVPRNGLFSWVEVLRQFVIIANFLLTSGNLAKVTQGQS